MKYEGDRASSTQKLEWNGVARRGDASSLLRAASIHPGGGAESGLTRRVRVGERTGEGGDDNARLGGAEAGAARIGLLAGAVCGLPPVVRGVIRVDIDKNGDLVQEEGGVAGGAWELMPSISSSHSGFFLRSRVALPDEACLRIQQQ